jgi:HPt (histidine-containing phosphotransfer) domain-containing protein
MAKDKPGTIEVKSFGTHHVITQPNPLRKVLLRVPESDLDDPVGRAEKALAGLSELFRAAHDIKGDAATFGYPSAAAAAESLCRIIEHAPDLDAVPPQLITHHINAVQAIVRERTRLDTTVVAGVLSKQLRGIADEFLTHANRDRPEHLEAILAPSIVPNE